MPSRSTTSENCSLFTSRVCPQRMRCRTSCGRRVRSSKPAARAALTFYLRRDPESQREVEFAVHENYLLLATREDLMASALQLMAGGKDSTIEAEPWFAQSVAAAGPVGDLRMVLNLEKIVPSPYFRSYWVQQNISEMKSYDAAVSDLLSLRQGVPRRARPAEEGGRHRHN